MIPVKCLEKSRRIRKLNSRKYSWIIGEETFEGRSAHVNAELGNINYAGENFRNGRDDNSYAAVRQFYEDGDIRISST